MSENDATRPNVKPVYPRAMEIVYWIFLTLMAGGVGIALVGLAQDAREVTLLGFVLTILDALIGMVVLNVWQWLDERRSR